MHKLTRDDTTHGEYYYRSSEVDAQPAQEPIGEAHQMYPHTAFTHCVWDARVVPTGTKLYTTPPQREWVGLTDEDSAVVREEESCSFIAGAKWAEEILRRKNT